MLCNCASRTNGAYLATMAWILAWVGGKFEVLGEELEVFVDVVKTLADEIGI